MGLHSSVIAKDRLKLLLLAERIQCSPNMLIMLKNDMIKTASKYVIIKEHMVSVSYNQTNNMITAIFPLDHHSFRKGNHFTNV
jgi:cell division topological specificity factor